MRRPHLPLAHAGLLGVDRRGFLIGALAFGASCAAPASRPPAPASQPAPASADAPSPASAPASSAGGTPAGRAPAPATTQALAELERAHGGRLGVAALDVATGRRTEHRAGERFPFCSTCKTLAVAATLHRVDLGKDRLDRSIAFTAADLLEHAPIAKQNLARGAMTIGEMCEATIQTSDNTCGNLLFRAAGGPSALNAYFRSLGDAVTRMDRIEPALNTALADDPRDTSSPRAIIDDLQQLFLGDALRPASRDQLIAWHLGTQTGKARIRAGIPADWKLAHKTGTGEHGATNDIGIAWSPTGAATLIAIYYVDGPGTDADRESVLAAAARIITAA